MRQFRSIIIVFFLFLIIPNGFGQVDVDNAVISGLIRDYFKQKPNDTVFNKKGKIKKIRQYHNIDLNLVSETDSHLLDSKTDSLSLFQKRGLVSLDFKMYSDFIKNNKVTANIDSVKGFDGNITYLSTIDIKAIFDKGGWENYHKIYGFKPLVRISRLGLNTNMNRAFIYFSSSMDGLGGAGYYVILEKVNEKWVIKETMLAWIS